MLNILFYRYGYLLSRRMCHRIPAMGRLIMAVSGTDSVHSLCFPSLNISIDWQQNIYGLNSNFGSANDLQALARALHARDMVGEQRVPPHPSLLS